MANLYEKSDQVQYSCQFKVCLSAEYYCGLPVLEEEEKRNNYNKDSQRVLGLL